MDVPPSLATKRNEYHDDHTVVFNVPHQDKNMILN